MAKESIKWGSADTPVEAIKWGAADQPVEAPVDVRTSSPAAPAPQEVAAPAPASGDPIGTGAAEIMDVAQPKLESVLQGRTMPEQPFDPAEGERLSNRAAAEADIQPGDPRFNAPHFKSGDTFEPVAQRTGKDLAGDATAAALKIGPTALQTVAQIYSMLSFGQIGPDASRMMDTGMQAIDKQFGSKASAQERMQLARVLTDPNKGAGDLASFLTQHPVLMADMGITTVGSMFVPSGASKLVSTLTKTGTLPAEIATDVANRANALMNAGQTYEQTEGDQSHKMLAALIAGASSHAIGKVTDVGAAGVLSRELTGSEQAMTRAQQLKDAAMALPREAVQEYGENFGQSVGQDIGEQKVPDLGNANKQGVLGAMVAPIAAAPGSTHVAVRALAPRDTSLIQTPEDLGARIKRLRDAGEKDAADLLEKRIAQQRLPEEVDRELGSMQTEAARTPEFQNYYRELRTAGVKPVEAAGRTSMVTDFRTTAAAAGMSEKAIAAAVEAGQKKNLADLPGFLHRYTQSLAAKGLAQPVDVGSQLESARDTGMDAAMTALYPDDVQQNMADVQSLEQAMPPAPGAGVPQINTGHDIVVTPDTEAAHAAATSPLNDLPEPTQAQKEAGNYKVGRLNIAGMDISVENPQGSTRSGVDADGTPWETPMNHHYGYFRGTLAADGDKLDVFVVPGTPESYRGPVFVVDQIDPRTGKFDEHKVILGASNEAEAEAIYRSNYSADWQGLGAITRLPMPAFKAWATSGHTKEALGDIQTPPQQTTETRQAAAPLPADQATAVTNGPAGVQPGAVQHAGEAAGRGPTDQSAAVEAPAEPTYSAADVGGGRELVALRNDNGKFQAVDESGKIIPESPEFNTGPEADHWRRMRNRTLSGAKQAAPVAGETAAHPVTEDRRHEARGADRRTALDQRKRVAEMTEPELRKALLTDHLTGLPNGRAYDESVKLPAQVSIDADSLKWVNDNLGHESGDQLLKAIGQALGEETREAYHVSGDEFVVQAHTEAEASAIMERARLRMSQARIEATDAQGKDIVLTGVGVSYGIAGDLNEAERFLGRDKAQRESQGLRAARGEVPPNAAVRSRGEENQARGAAAEEVNQGDKKKSAPTPDTPKQQQQGRPDTGMQERPVRAEKSGSAEPAQSVVGAGSAANTSTLSKKAEAAGIEAANSYLKEQSKFDVQREIKSIDANGDVDTHDMGDNPKYWDSENEEYTEAGQAEVDRRTQALAEERAGYHPLTELSDLNGADQSAQAEAMHAIAESLGLDSRKSYSSGGSRYVEIDIGGQDYKFRFADHFNTTRDSTLQPDFNVAPGRNDFTEAVDFLLGKIKESTPAEKPVSQMSAADHLRAAADKMETKPETPAQPITDFGEKIGGARKDTAVSTGPKSGRSIKPEDTRPAWARRFQISEIVRAGGQIGEVRNEGRWVIRDTRSLDWMKQPKQVGRETFSSREAAEKALPLLAVAQRHRVVPATGPNGTQAWEIWRDINDRKRVKVVDLQFGSRDDAMRYMAEHAEQIIEANTTFGEADLPVPEDKQRIGAERRQGDVKGEDFRTAFGFRGVEFGNWNNQDERQQLMNEAYDGLMDLAEVMGIPPTAISLNGDLALAFGARGHGLSGARAHYEPDRAVMNLTKMKGAGALAHEWFHALDHYFGRQDGKAPVTWVTNKDGTRSLKVNGDFENNAVSSGFSRTNSGVREEVRSAINKVMTTMAKKAEQYVEDTAKTERFVAAVRNDVEKQLDGIRRDLAEQKDVRYYKRNNKPASAEQLAEFDGIAQRILAGEALDTELRAATGAKALTGMRWTNDALEQISAIYKAVRGRNGFDGTDHNGLLDRLRQYMSLYSARLKMLAEAQTGAEKTKQVPTDFAMDAKSLDQGRGTDYWTTPHEMAARAFQGYVEDKIAEDGGKSPFLNYGPENAGILTPWGAKRPYPAGAERKAINAAFDDLVKVIKTRETEQGTAMYARGGPVWRSALRDGIEGINAKALTPAMWQDGIKGLLNKGAVKADEVEWSGITDWLKLQTGKVTKEQVLDYLNGNGVRVEEVQLSNDTSKAQGADARRAELENMSDEDFTAEVDQWLGVEVEPDQLENRDDLIDKIMREQADSFDSRDDRDAAGMTKYGSYTIPGGTNYREVLLTLPDKRRAALNAYVEELKSKYPKWKPSGLSLDTYATPAEIEKHAELLKQELANKEPAVSYRSPHWEQSNVLAHIRLDDRIDANGKRVLFVNEIQSDWGQSGKKSGFYDPAKPYHLIDASKSGGTLGEFATQEEAEAAGKESGIGTWDISYRPHARGAVTIAPFVTKTDAWVSLALKRIVKMAVDEGYDKVAFINGQQSADRYDLSKQVKTITAYKSGDGFRISAKTINGEQLPAQNVGSVAELEGFVGKELASKIAEQKRDVEIYSGLDLKVGGEGMKTFYDQIVPNAVKKLLPKVGGGQIGTTDISVPDDSAQNRLRYTGYEPTRAELNSLQKMADGYGNVKVSPFTNRPLDYSIDRVMVASEIKNIRKAMDAGESFKNAMVEHGSSFLAEVFGGKIEPVPLAEQKALSTPQHSFTITPAMREKAAQGLPMFARGMNADAFRRAFRAPQTMAVDDAQKLINEITATWENGPKFKAVATAEDLPVKAPVDTRGWVSNNGTAYIVAGNHVSRDAIARTLAHEAIGHYGLWKILGNDGKASFERNLQLALKSGNKPLNAIRDKVRRLYVDDAGKFNLNPKEEANEIAAFAVEQAVDPVTGEFRTGFSWLKQSWARIADFLRGLHIPVKFTNAELQGLLVASMKGLQAGHRLDGGAETLVAAARSNAMPAPFQAVKTKNGLSAYRTDEIALAAPRLNPRQPGGGLSRIDYSIRDQARFDQAMAAGQSVEQARDASHVGFVTMDVDGAGQFKALRYIMIFESKRKGGTAAKVVGSIMASLPDNARLHIYDILPAATGFWDKMGAKFARSEDFMEAHLSPQQFRSAYAAQRSAIGTRDQSQHPVQEADTGTGQGRPGADGAMAPRTTGEEQSGAGAGEETALARGAAAAMPPTGAPPESRTGQADMFQPNGWSTPEPTRTDRIIYDLQDGRVDLKRVQQAIEAAGQKIEEKWNARLAETLYPGRVAYRAKTFLNAEVKPLLKAMAGNKVGMTELADYLHARGAEERNVQIAKVNPDLPDGGAGRNSEGVLMTTQAARDYLAAIQAKRKAVLDDLAQKVDAITAGTRKLLVDEGLEKQETIDAWEAAYKNYVPMFRDEAETALPPHPQGTGFAVRGKASRRATGSTKEVTNILAHVLMQREAAITRAEKNRVALSLYGQALTHPNPEFWTTIKPGMSNAQIAAELQAMGVDPLTARAGMEGVPTIRTVDDTTGKVIDRPNPLYKSLPGAIPLKVAGEDRVLMLNAGTERGARLAENLKNLDGLTRLDLANSIVGRATRWLAAMNTQYNPAFGLVNLTRDTLGGAINLGSTELRGKTLKVLADAPFAIFGIARDLATGKDGKWGKLYQQFVADGGQTGYKELWRDPSDRTRAIEKELSREGKLTPGKAAHAILDLLDGFNTTMESAIRVSAYAEALKQGMSRAEAARLGRELTVDFNRKGRAGRELGPLYAFFNASVQGVARTIETLKGPTGAKIIAGGLALGALQALMLATAGYDDDDIPEFVKTRSLIIPTNWSGEGKKTHIMIPYPLGLHVIPNTSRVLTELVLNGGKNIGQRTVGAIGDIAAAFNPLGGGNIFTAHGALTTIAPTVVDPIVDLAANQNFAGGTIERQGYGEADNRPGAARVKESTQRAATGQVYIGISKAINRLTGGTEYEAGMVSPTPERIRYLAQTVGGGLLRELEKGINAGAAAARGEPVKSSQVPVVGRFYGNVEDDQVQTGRYIRNAAQLRALDSSFQAMTKAGDAAAMERLLKTNPEVALVPYLNEIQRSITELNKAAVLVIDDPKQLADIDAARAELMRGVNTTIKEMDKALGKSTLADRLKPAKKPEPAAVE